MARKRKTRYQYIRQRFPKKMQKKLVMLFMAVVLAFVVLIGRITYINASNGEKYTRMVLEQQQYDSRMIPFKRGDITDRNGTKIATSERVYNVILDAKVLLAKEERVDKTMEVLETCFEIDTTEAKDILENDKDSRYKILAKGISYQKSKEFEAIEEACKKAKKEKDKIAGIWLEEDYVRTYPYNMLASDMIGFTSSGNVGTGGLEQSYNDVLNGTDGREYGYLNSDASFERTVKDAVDGNTVVSTIDLNLQSIVEKHIREFNEEHKGDTESGMTLGSKNTAVMIANPNTGEILAQASYPNYDLNNPRDLTLYYSQEKIDGMSKEEKVAAMQGIWRDFCVSDTYEPGSVMNPFTIAAGLESGKLTGNETYVCGGSLRPVAGAQNIGCHKLEGHGTQNLEQAIANSCNVALMYMGMEIGAEDFCKYQRIFGFGQYTGIDLPGEAATAGLLYTAENMGTVDLAVNAFGQSFNLTMVQNIAAFSSLINGGNYYEPHIVKQIQDSKGNVIENNDPVLVKRTVSEKTSGMLKEYMRATMTYGTGKRAAVEGYDIGAKTGTAEKVPRGTGKHLLSFCGFAPVDKPEVLVYVVIDEPNVDNQANSEHVLELSRRIMEEAFPYLNITKSAPAQTE